MAKHFTFKFYSDPGHGWLSVKRTLLMQFPEAALSISPYSYQNAENVHLEEDCDCQVFLEALRKAGHSFVVVEKNSESRMSRIRSFDRFCLSQDEKRALAEARLIVDTMTG